MEVVIDGVKYIPESENRITVHGIEYNNIPHWLYNIDCILINKWISLLKEDEIPDENPEAVKLKKRVEEFRNFAKEYLGFEYDKDKYCFKEINL